MQPPRSTQSKRRPKEGQPSQSREQTTATSATHRHAQTSAVSHQHDASLSTPGLARRGRRRRAYDEDERREVAAVRKLGACENCRRKRVKCLHARSTSHPICNIPKGRERLSDTRHPGSSVLSLNGSNSSPEASSVDTAVGGLKLDDSNVYVPGDPITRYVGDVSVHDNPVRWLTRCIEDKVEWREEGSTLGAEDEPWELPQYGNESNFKDQESLNQKDQQLSSYLPTQGKGNLLVFPTRVRVPGENTPYLWTTGTETTQPPRIKSRVVENPIPQSQLNLQMQQHLPLPPASLVSTNTALVPQAPFDESAHSSQSLSNFSMSPMNQTPPLPLNQSPLLLQPDYDSGHVLRNNFSITESRRYHYSVPPHYDNTMKPPQQQNQFQTAYRIQRPEVPEDRPITYNSMGNQTSFQTTAHNYFPEDVSSLYSGIETRLQQDYPPKVDYNNNIENIPMIPNDMGSSQRQVYSQVAQYRYSSDHNQRVYNSTNSYLTPYDYANFSYAPTSLDDPWSGSPSFGFGSSSMPSAPSNFDASSNHSASGSFQSSNPRIRGSPMVPDVLSSYTVALEGSTPAPEELTEKQSFNWQEFLNS